MLELTGYINVVIFVLAAFFEIAGCFAFRKAPVPLAQGKTRALLTGAQVDEVVCLHEEGWSLRAVGRHIGRSLKEVPAAVSDQGGAIRSKGERPPTRGAPNYRR
jgi:uncharacterized protein YjhX (UPF0386 family)